MKGPSPGNEPFNLPAIKALAWKEFCCLDGVEGLGLGDGKLRVYVRDAEAARQIPATYEGVPIEIVISGHIVAA